MLRNGFILTSVTLSLMLLSSAMYTGCVAEQQPAEDDSAGQTQEAQIPACRGYTSPVYTQQGSCADDGALLAQLVTRCTFFCAQPANCTMDMDDFDGDGDDDLFVCVDNPATTTTQATRSFQFQCPCIPAIL